MKALTAAITTIRRTIAHWLYQPFAVTAWEPERTTTALLPALAQQQAREVDDLFFELPNLLEGIIGGPEWHGAPGSLLAARRHKPLKRRDTGVLVLLAQHPPMSVQNTSPIQRLATRLTPIPETTADRPLAPCPPFDFDPLKTVMPIREVLDLGFSNLVIWETPEEQQRAAIARLDEARANSGALSRLYDDPPVLAPLPEQSQIGQRLTASSALIELASQKESNETVEVPAYMRKRAMRLQEQLMRESE